MENNLLDTLTMQEVAKILKCNSQTVSLLVDSGKLPGICITTGKRKFRRVTRQALEDFLNAAYKAPSERERPINQKPSEKPIEMKKRHLNV